MSKRKPSEILCEWCGKKAEWAMGSGAKRERACTNHRRQLRVPIGADGDSYRSEHLHGERWVPTVSGVTPCCSKL